MEIVLLERVESLGQLGDVVNVKPGYARNFLLPQKKALRATKANMVYFEKQKADLQTQNATRRKDAEAEAKSVDGMALVIIRQASESGQLYGSVAARDIAESLTEQGHKLDRRQVLLNEPLKMLGIFPVRIALHPEVSVQVTVNVARSPDEAKIQALKGKAVLRSESDEEEAPAKAVKIFELEEEQPEV